MARRGQGNGTGPRQGPGMNQVSNPQMSRSCSKAIPRWSYSAEGVNFAYTHAKRRSNYFMPKASMLFRRRPP
jgi:hypothetical protein